MQETRRYQVNHWKLTVMHYSRFNRSRDNHNYNWKQRLHHGIQYTSGMYIKCKSILKENIQKSYYLLLWQCPKMLKIKLNQRKGWIKASATFDVLDPINITKYIIFKFEDQNYLHLSNTPSKDKFLHSE